MDKMRRFLENGLLDPLNQIITSIFVFIALQEALQ